MDRYTIIKNGTKMHQEGRKENYPKICVEHTKGQLFFMAFCYLPDGCKILLGDYSKISEYIEEKYDTCCHAMMKPCSKRIDLLLKPKISILGKNSNQYTLMRGTKEFILRRTRRNSFYGKTPHLDMPKDNHRYWVLMKKILM